MKNRAYHPSGSRFLMTGTALVVLAGTLAAVAFNPFKALKRARMAEAVNNCRQVSLAMHTFAMDNDGRFPSKALAQLHGLPPKVQWSNDLFRQLLAAEYIQSEQIFWVKGAKACNRQKPDDVIATDGKFDASETLQAGDCGWAYVSEQTTTAGPQRPLLVDAWMPGTSAFDRKIWDGKVTVGRIDGSVVLLPLDPKGVVLFEDEVLLGAKSAIWKDSAQDPAKLLMQPEPAKQPEGKKDLPPEAGEGSAPGKE